MTPEGNKKAIELLERAVAADARLARAWVALSGAHQQSIDFGADPAPLVQLSLAEARRAVEIDPRDAMAHAQLAFALGVNGAQDRPVRRLVRGSCAPGAILYPPLVRVAWAFEPSRRFLRGHHAVDTRPADLEPPRNLAGARF